MSTTLKQPDLSHANSSRQVTSILHQLDNIYEEIRQTYLQDDAPWVIGFSGGKDSTTVLQLTWYALEALPVEQRTKPVYVISTDTLVETPVIVDHITENLRLINQEAETRNMPFKAQKLSPILDDTFWVNLLGRGYPAPNSGFRWCTDRLKINPSNRFILDKVAEFGEVILALGSRRDESSTRNQVLNMHRFTGKQLARHGQLPGAWVYMPIEHFSTDDIWTYLLQIPSPWGGDNRQLSSLYQTAQDGECPLVVDTSTPSCGNSRFGCWVCTVVTRDKSMEAMIDAGEDWMIPLLNYRDWLVSTQDPAVKPEQREYKGRDGRIKITDEGQLRYRSYTLEFSKIMLKRLLEAQHEIQEHKPEFTLISADELLAIRRLWITERQDWQDSLPAIYTQVTGHLLNWVKNDVYSPGKIEAETLQQLCEEFDIPLTLTQKLLDAEWQHYGMRRRAKIHKTIEKVFREDWRTLDEVYDEMRYKQQTTGEIA